MPPLCISLLALLLLPLSLSCNSKNTLKAVAVSFRGTVGTDLENANKNVTVSLQNRVCAERKHKLENCTSGDKDKRDILLNLACKMHTYGLPNTETLVSSVIHTIGCSCPDKPTRAPNVTSRRAKRERQHERGKEGKREKRRLCHAKAILSAITVCSQMLNGNEAES